MSSVKFFPIRWFEDFKWKSIQVVGRLENNRSIFLRIGFRPYFTVRYNENVEENIIDETHDYLLSATPIADIVTIETHLYRIYVSNKDDYFESISFYRKNGLGVITDDKQSIVSKFLADRKLIPEVWQEASNLKTLLFNITTNKRYAATDLEYYTDDIVSINYDAPIPQEVLVFYDIEAIPSDNVSFPDAELDRPPDKIFSISLVVTAHEITRNIVILLTDEEFPQIYQTDPERTDQEYPVIVIPVSTEKELLDTFFKELQYFRPDRLIGMNSRRFDMNYIGARSRLLKVTPAPFTKILSFQPYFRQKTIVQTEPFPSTDQVWTISTPGISQIDILDFYRRRFPELGNHRLETLGQLVLNRGKTGLDTHEMFKLYRKGGIEDLSVIIDYSITDSILLRDLWEASQIRNHLAQMANFWINDAEYVISTGMEKLFEDLIRYISPNVPDKRYNVGRTLTTERVAGIHRNVYLYSLSNIYITFLEQIDDPVAQIITKHFRGSLNGIIPFKSGYFPVTFNQVKDFVNEQIPKDQQIWIEEYTVAVKAQNMDNLEQGPYPFFPLFDFIPLIIIDQKSWILLGRSGLIFKKGFSRFVRPPFPLLKRYIDYLIRFLIEHPNESITFPQLETTLDDFVLESKVTGKDFSHRSPTSQLKSEIIRQLTEINWPVPSTWQKIKYIQTVDGIVIEQIYSQDPSRYIVKIDGKYYNKILQDTLKSLLKFS